MRSRAQSPKGKYPTALLLAIMAASLTAASALAAGPGSVGPPPMPEGITPITVAFRSVALQDGWILESSETSNIGGSLDRIATTFNVGDDPKDRQYRGLLSFNTASLPDTAIVAAAQLKVKRQGIVGTDPFTTHGPLLSVIRRGAFSGSLALELSDFSAPKSPGSIRDRFEPLTYSWYRTVLSYDNLQFVNRFGVTQFRLFFSLDDNDDLSADYMKFFSGNSDVANQPELLITYWMP